MAGRSAARCVEAVSAARPGWEQTPQAGTRGRVPITFVRCQVAAFGSTSRFVDHGVEPRSGWWCRRLQEVCSTGKIT